MFIYRLLYIVFTSPISLLVYVDVKHYVYFKLLYIVFTSPISFMVYVDVKHYVYLPLTLHSVHISNKLYGLCGRKALCLFTAYFTWCSHLQ